MTSAVLVVAIARALAVARRPAICPGDSPGIDASAIPGAAILNGIRSRSMSALRDSDVDARINSGAVTWCSLRPANGLLQINDLGTGNGGGESLTGWGPIPMMRPL